MVEYDLGVPFSPLQAEVDRLLTLSGNNHIQHENAYKILVTDKCPTNHTGADATLCLRYSNDALYVNTSFSTIHYCTS